MSWFSGKNEKELQEVRRELELLKSELDQREPTVSQREQLADERAQQLNALEKSLLKREQEIKKAEAEAQSGFAAKCREDFQKLYERWKAELDQREASLKEYEERLVVQARGVIESDGRAAERERLLTERELRADAGFADRNRALLEEVVRRDEACRHQEERLRGWEDEYHQRADSLAHRDAALANREREIEQHEIEADAGFAQRNHDALAALVERRESIVQELQALENQLRTEEQSRRQALDAALEQHAEEQRNRVDTQRVAAISQFQEIETTNRAALARFETRHAELLTEIESLSREVHERRMQQLQRIEEELRVEAESRRKELARSLEQERTSAVAIRQAEEETRKKEMARQQEDLARQRDDLRHLREEIEQREIAIQRRDLELRTREALVNEDREQLKRQIQERTEEAVVDWQRRYEQRESTIEDLRQECSALEQRLEAYDDMHRRLENQEPKQVLQRLREQRDEITRLKEELADRPLPELKDRVETIAKEKATIQEQYDKLRREAIVMRGEQGKWQAHANELEIERNQREVAERRCDTFAVLNKALREQLEQLRKLYEKPKEKEERLGVIQKPYLPRLETSSDGITEDAWLGEIHENCKQSGLVFPRRLLYAFHTAVKTAEWAPLTVLAGVSGTGKSELPRLYARFGGLNFLPLAVQPNWDSPQSLFGFYNSVDNRFNAMPLLQCLEQSQRAKDEDNGLKDQLLLVLLDEMNLAHVELYFSDLLSKLELRRGKDEERLEIDLGAGLEKHPVTLGRNVLWSGTMNEDETTKSLSDKVLDRGNILLFPRPRKLWRREQVELAPERTRRLSFDTWQTWLHRKSPFQEEQIRSFKKLLEDMNDRLEPVGRALGHRVWQSIEYYMANYPTVGAALTLNRQDDLAKAMCTAFEDQIVQKIMPKLRGIETSGKIQKQCLDHIRELLASFDHEGNKLHVTDDFSLACSAGFGGFLWKSAKYLEAGA